ncbi:MAG TPA: hypothetical protein VFR87_13575 [Nocardioidaceae bacterium]|nr:hypothetical protein [Nocardioidaceae bacterium]
MTGQLTVRVHAMMYEADRSDGVRVVGSVIAADHANPSHRDLMIPLGDDVVPTRLDLPPGRYFVEATLPSGDVLSEDVTVNDGASTDVQLRADESPQETHSLQYVLGNVESGPVFWSADVYPVPHSMGSRSFEQRLTPPPSPPAAVPPTVTSAGFVRVHPEVALLRRASDTRLTCVDLNTLADRTPVEAVADVQHTLGAAPGTSVQPDVPNPVAPLYRLTQSSAGAPLSGPGPHYLTVTAADDAYLVTLPLPWTDTDGRDATVEVLVNLRQGPTSSAVSVAVTDPAVGAGLAYMASGHLEKAAAVFRDVREMLLGKVSNPLAAAAAGYVLIGTETTSEPQYWDPWLRNLMAWFPTISDGAILCGARRLRSAHDDDEVVEGRRCLLEGYRRGLPVYTLGLSWLIDGLSMFPEDAECAAALQQVRRISFRVNMREPFVILRLGESGS